jgi:asparagine synthase (glutamine-hydrolysing)
MCGIAGFWTARILGEPPLLLARDMADQIAHRGPDDAGEWHDPEAGLVLAHRRLAVVDVTAEGHQPMVSASGRYVIVYNGEVYNHAELRRELHSGVPSRRYRGHSDTEVILAAIENWGLKAAVRRFVGMFAFALWDAGERTLYLVRDRVGIKPLYYGWMAGTLVFASELRALRSGPGFLGEIDPDALTLLLRHNCIPAPYSIYRGINKLDAGTILTLRSPADRTEPVPFWSARAVAEAGHARPFDGTPAEAVSALDTILRDAVRLRMIADVPLGAFLSGGVDSSTVVALMQAQSDRPVRTFAIGSPASQYDEARHAAVVARHLGTDHTELYVTDDDARMVVPRLPELMDEPFADSSLIPTYLVAALARRDVTVSLSGDGGDELFGGYNRHLWGGRVRGLASRLPSVVRRVASRTLTALSPDRWDAIFERAEPLIPRSLRQRMPGYKLHKLAAVITADSAADMYLMLASHWTEPASVVRHGAEPGTLITKAATPIRGLSFVEQMMYLDLVTYLPDDILTKVDRASMAVSLEARVPLLDHRVVEFAWSLPLSLKIRAGDSKWVLRQVLYRYVPRRVIDRPKSGFSVPLDAWLRGPLREWAEHLLDEQRLRSEGFFDVQRVRAVWHQHLSGRYGWHYHLWDVLMFQAWLESQRGAGPRCSARGLS